MDKTVDGALLETFVHKLRQRSYSELSKFIRDPQCEELRGRDGKTCQIEFEAFWDSPRREERNLRVMASLDNGAFGASFHPMTKSFIMAADVLFVGEPPNRT